MKKGSSSIWYVTFSSMLRRWHCLLIVILTLVATLSAVTLGTLIKRQKAAIEAVISDTVIRCVITDPKGLEKPSQFSSEMVNTILEDPVYREYITDIQIMKDHPVERPVCDWFREIYSLQSDPELVRNPDVQVHFYEGYTEEIFQTGRQVCLIPASHVARYPDGIVHVQHLFPEISVDLTIIGTWEGSEDAGYYVPYGMQWNYSEGTQTFVTFVSHCEFFIRDNARLEEAKESLWNSTLFQKPERTNREDGKNGLLIQDETYQKTLREMKWNLLLLQILYPVLLLLIICVGFFAGNLFTRGRLKEFAVMRCLGLKQRRIFGLVFGEFLLLALVGGTVGLLVGFSLDGRLEVEALWKAALLTIVFLLGAAIATVHMTRVNVMKLMKVED